jgi:hypothetical protein
LSANRRHPSKTTQHQRQMQRRQAAAARNREPAGPAPGPRRPLPPGESLLTLDAGPLRRAVERRSAPFLIVMHRLPRLILPLLMAVLFGIGVIVAGPLGIVALCLLLAFLGWLSYLSWPAVNARGRVIRLALLVLLVGLVIMQITEM